MMRSLVRSLVGRMTVVMSPRGHVRLLCSSGVLSQHIMHWMIYVVQGLGSSCDCEKQRAKTLVFRVFFTWYTWPGSSEWTWCALPRCGGEALRKRSVRRALRAQTLREAAGSEVERESARGAQALKKRSEGSRCTSGGAASRSQPRRVTRERSRSAGAEEAQTPEEGEVALEERRR